MKRPAVFVLGATNYGTMILNRNDYDIPKKIEPWYTIGPYGDYRYGVGNQLLEESEFEADLIECGKFILDLKRAKLDRKVIILDCGANIGTHTVAWALHTTGWGFIHSFEPQAFTYYALAGNVALNNCFNVTLYQAAIGDHVGSIPVPQADYTTPSSFGALSLIKGGRDIGQPISYDEKDCIQMPLITIDYLKLQVDFIKLDVEGMELDVLTGATDTLLISKPVIMYESVLGYCEEVEALLVSIGYTPIKVDASTTVAIHSTDPILNTFISRMA